MHQFIMSVGILVFKIHKFLTIRFYCITATCSTLVCVSVNLGPSFCTHGLVSWYSIWRASKMCSQPGPNWVWISFPFLPLWKCCFGSQSKVLGKHTAPPSCPCGASGAVFYHPQSGVFSSCAAVGRLDGGPFLLPREEPAWLRAMGYDAEWESRKICLLVLGPGKPKARRNLVAFMCLSFLF